jgi:hypothetical protein
LPREKTFAALLPTELSSRTGRRIDLYNESFFFESPRVVALRLNEALAAKPDMILWILSPWDIDNASLLLPAHVAPKAGLVTTAFGLAKTSRAGVLLQHFLYKSPNSFVKQYLIGGGGSGFLDSNLSPEWQRHLHEIDGYASEIEARAKAAGVPVAVVLVPFRAQAAMISEGEWLAGFDPYKLDRELRTIVVDRGGTYLDILPGFRQIPNTEQDFFVTDGHPNAAGHLIISELLTKELTSGAVPALRAVVGLQTEKEASR